LTSAEASSFRGKIQWLDSRLAGKPCRGALGALIARQYWERTNVVHPRLDDCLAYLSLAAYSLPSRFVPVHRSSLPPVVVYSDCSARNTALRIGVLILRDGAAYAASCDVPLCVVQAWVPRGQYISLGELLAGPVCVALGKSLLWDRDVLWFVDNTAAVAALIKSGSAVEDMGRVALVHGLSMVSCRARAWYEYVNTKANPADVLSRDAWADPVVAQRVRSGSWLVLHGHVPWRDFVQNSLVDIFRSFAALGS